MAVVVMDRDDLMQMFSDFREQITQEIRESLPGSVQGVDGYWNKKDTAKFLSIAETTLDQWRRKEGYNFPKPRQTGRGHVLFKKSEVIDWVEKQKVGRNEVA